MATILEPNQLSSVVRETNFTATITANANGSSITSVTATLDVDDPGIIITSGPGTDNVTISGQHTSAFTDTATYVVKGSSDILSTPITITGDLNNDLPEQQDVYVYKPDPRGSITRTFNVVVTTAGSTETIPITQVVENNIQGFTTFIHNYFAYERGQSTGNIETDAYIEWTNQYNEIIDWKTNDNKTTLWTQN